MSFFTHLISNGSMTYYPGNKPSNFRTKLPTNIISDKDEFEVSLTEIHYFKAFHLLANAKDQEIRVSFKTGPTQVYKIPNIHFRSIEHFLEEINKVLSKLTSQNHFSYYPTKNRVVFTCNSVDKNIRFIGFSKKVNNALGFDFINFMILDKKLFVATNPPNLMNQSSKLFVYSDIISPQIVGDSLVKLLRIVPIEGEEEHNVIISLKPQYVKISKSMIDDIQIYICDEFGEEITFASGITVVTLHFRKIQNQYGSSLY